MTEDNSVIQLKFREPSIAAEIHRVSKAAYGVEAKLIGINNQPECFPPLRETSDDIQSIENGCFYGIRDVSLAAVLELETNVQAGTINVHINRLVTDPRYFRRGFASKLIAYVLKQSVAQQTSSDQVLSVETAAKNHIAIDLYQRFGFSITQKFRDPADDIDLVRLTK